jgi:hypothetical protein
MPNSKIDKLNCRIMKNKTIGSVGLSVLILLFAFGIVSEIKAAHKYSCTVTTNCLGGSISCTGDVTCERTPTSVTCDGHTTNC